MVEDGVVMDGRRDAEGYAHQDRDPERPGAVGERHRKPLTDDLVDGLILVAERRTEVELGDDRDEVAPHLYDKRLVEPVLALEIGHDFGRQRALGVEWSPGSGVHQHIGHDDQDQQRRNRYREPLEEVGDHRSSRHAGACRETPDGISPRRGRGSSNTSCSPRCRRASP